MELVAAGAIVGGYCGAMYGYYRFLCWLEGPKRRTISTGDTGLFLSEDDLLNCSSLLNGEAFTDEELLRELDLDLSVLKHMEPDDRVKFVDAKLQGIAIARRRKLFNAFSMSEQIKDGTAACMDSENNGGVTSTVHACEVSCELKACCDEEKRPKPAEVTDEEIESEENLIKADLGKLEVADLNVRSGQVFYGFNEKIDKNTSRC